MWRVVFAAALAAWAAAGPAQAKPPVWVVRDADSELVLFGSVHVLPDGLDWRPPALTEGLAKAEDVWFEMPMDAESEAQSARLAAARGLLPPGRSLQALLPPKTWERLLAAAQRYRLSPDMLARMEPWLAEVALSGAVYQLAGASPAMGVEKQVHAAAPAGAVRKAFETPAQQIAFFDEAPLADQIASLEHSLEEIERDPEAFSTLVGAWMAGDLAKLETIAIEPLRAAAPVIYRRVVTERNAVWARELDARLKGRGRTVVVVGVGHLIGPESLPAKLRALGYTVEGP
ncbi:TraB/GumN family protein [Phenylobacterium terrae]|uniref:TraB/GumN family protein n=1 Tax=Phenylobacterium terrae TaxID=2665495 RepID=A0ABW4N0J1_9CAUL